ncbi:hypothetical protein ACFQV4_12360 [Streptomyces thermocarboxydus]
MAVAVLAAVTAVVLSLWLAHGPQRGDSPADFGAAPTAAAPGDAGRTPGTAPPSSAAEPAAVRQAAPARVLVPVSGSTPRSRASA